MHGTGVLTFTDGSKYAGKWEDDRISGQGSLTFFDGKIYKGEWKDNKFIMLGDQ
jgi:hypothetical protein